MQGGKVADLTRHSLVKPTLQTRFHIDFTWWTQNARDWHVFLNNYLCAEHKKAFANWKIGEEIDWVDPKTAEVHSVDGMQHVLISHCAKQAGFITQQSALMDSVFRIFLSNGNMPLTSIEIAERLGKKPDLILKTISGQRTYGLRPCMD